MTEVIDFNQLREGQKEEVRRGSRHTAQEIMAKRRAREKEDRDRKRRLTLEAWEAEDQRRPYINPMDRMSAEEHAKIKQMVKLSKERSAQAREDARNNAAAQREAERLETLRGRNREALELTRIEVSQLEERMNKKFDLILEKLENASK
ncbi:hypothetical protein [Myxosarcina sp. GI1(2024)]